MDSLRLERNAQCLTNLKKAEEYIHGKEKTVEIMKLLAITLNNLGCYYKKVGKHPLALKSLQQA